MMKISSRILIIIILLFGFIIRVWDLQAVPAGFFADEASVGYNAYTIAHSGRDEHGKIFPFFFEAFGEYKNPVAIYSTVPFVLIFGLNEYSVRLVSALYGTAGIFALYLLTKKMFQKNSHHETIALLSAFFLTITPWDIHLSRIMLEGITAFIFFTSLGSYYFLKQHEHFRKHFLLSITFFTLAFYSYFPARIFIPLLFLLLILIFHKALLIKKHLNTLLLGVLLLCLFSIPLVGSIYDQTLLNRWKQVNIFTNQTNEMHPIIHVTKNYLSHFSPDFLFFKGDSGMERQAITRHSVREFGELYVLQLPLILIGLFFLIKKDRRLFMLLFGWMLLYPSGSMFTTDATAQATRSAIGIIPLTILSGIGTWYLMERLHRLGGFLGKITTVFLLAIIISCSILYLKSYYMHYNMYASDFWGWQFGPRETMSYFLKNHDNYDDLYMSGEFNGGHIFLKFYDPKNICQSKCKLGDFTREPTLYMPERKQLFSLSPEYIEASPLRDSFKTLKTIYYPNGKVAFKIGMIVQ